jgi:hypothetical protein
VFEGEEILRQDTSFPEPEIVNFPLPKETLPVYGDSFDAHGRVRLRFPLPEGALILRGGLRFQQCNESICEPPQTILFELTLTHEPFLVSDSDRRRSARTQPKS